MRIEKKEVAHVASLSCLALNEGETDAVQADLTEILRLIDTLSHWEDLGDGSVADALQNVTREDAVQPSFDREALLRNAAVRNEQGIIVPQTVE